MLGACTAVEDGGATGPEPDGPGDPTAFEAPDCGPFDPEVTSHLQSLLEVERRKASSLGMNLGVRQGCHEWIGAAGAAKLDESEALTPDSRFRIYSITKTFTAALTLRLVEREQLELTDPLSRWYPDLPNASEIRIRHLLTHTSGLFDCLTDDEVVAERHRTWDHDELIARVAMHPTSFEPGEGAQYVNTNYFLLGRIIEEVTGEPYEHLLREELLHPLGLEDTFLAGYEDLGLSYVEGAKHTLAGRFTDATDAWDDSLTWAAGGLVSSAQDQLDWFSALMDGYVVGREMLELLLEPATLDDGSTAPFGHGIAVTDSTEGPYYSHDGGGSGIGFLGNTAFGFHAHLGYLADHDLYLVVLANTGTSDISATRDAAMRYMVWGR